MNDKLKPNQEKIIIKNCVESIMEDLDDYYFDELFMKQYKKRLIEFFTKISEEHSLFSPGFDFSNKKNIVNDKEKIEKILWLIDASEPVITSTKQKTALIEGIKKILDYKKIDHSLS